MLRDALACLLLALPALAQPTTPPSQSPPQPSTQQAPPAAGGTAENPSGQRPIRLEDLPPGIRLGVRAEAVRRGWPVIPEVVIVPDEVSYAKAIGAWTIRARFPVLIDDGSERAREDIARFVRAFAPKRVVRWSAQGASWPAAAAERQAQIEAALFSVWSSALPNETAAPKISSQKDLIERWVKVGAPPPGIIATDAADPAWPAALALAAGRCQPIAWVHAEPNINAAMTPEGAESLEGAIETACESSGLPWRGLGDAVDAVTFCLNCPAKIQATREALIATTDLLGRLPEDSNTPKKEGVAADTVKPTHPSRVHGDRWAWCGQIFGNPSESAYRAMCALFLAPNKAWLFDGYPDTKPWSTYDATAAADPLKKVGWTAIVDDTPRQGEHAWRLRASRPVEAGLITINTKGGADEFNLEPGQCRPGDIPFLSTPAIVYCVHSWSAAVPGERSTVAGRWLERGAYAYFGSTQEPFLQAFVPTPAVTTRLASAFPWAAAVRYDGKAEAWKVATFGDPLITLGPAAARAEAALPLQGAVDLEETLRGLQAKLKSGAAPEDYVQTIVTLTLLGRDEVAAKLAAAVLRENPHVFTAAVAAASILPLHRAHDKETLVRAYAVLPANLASDGPRRDALWHACYTSMGGTRDEVLLGLLRTNLRLDQIGRDAAELSRALAQVAGRDTAVNLLTDAKGRCTTDYDRARIDEAMKALEIIVPRPR